MSTDSTIKGTKLRDGSRMTLQQFAKLIEQQFKELGGKLDGIGRHVEQLGERVADMESSHRSRMWAAQFERPMMRSEASPVGNAFNAREDENRVRSPFEQ